MRSTALVREPKRRVAPHSKNRAAGGSCHANACSLERPARCLVCEPKRRCRAALQDLRDAPGDVSVAPDLRCAPGDFSDARCREAFGVRCEAPLWSANLARERLLLAASRPLPRVRTKAALARRTPKIVRRTRWSVTRQSMRESLSFWSAVRSTALVREPTTRTPAPWSIPPAAWCANQSGAVAPHSKTCEMRQATFLLRRTCDVRQATFLMRRTCDVRRATFLMHGAAKLLECGAKHRFGPRT